MASTGSLWWITPLQALCTISAAVNFGASGFQTPITMPTLRNVSVPAHHAGTLVQDLLHRSEIIFPKLNAIGTLANLVMTGYLAYNYSTLPTDVSAKLPYIAGSLALSIGVTVYALTIMVPINTGMKANAEKLQQSPEDEVAAKKFREGQQRWQGYNMGRGSLMIAGAIVSIAGLLV